MKKFYVTKKQVNKYIASRLSLFSTDLDDMLEAVESTLVYLDSNEGEIFNSSQIKFYSRVKDRLVNMIKEASAKNMQC